MKMDSNLRVLHYILMLLFNLFPRTRAEVFTAIAEMEQLLETHKKVIDDLDYYINKEEQRLTDLKRQLDLYNKEHEKAMDDIPNYLGNPINAFTIMKRLSTDLKYMQDNIRMGSENITNVTMIHEDYKYPEVEDLTGAALGLTRLQKTYLLDVQGLAEGKLNDVVYSAPMTASDCYELGRILHTEKDYKNGLAWMMEALRKYKTEDIPHPFTEADILEHISNGFYLIGDIRKALDWTQLLLTIDPNHPRARDNVSQYQNSIDEEENRLREKGQGKTSENSQELKKHATKNYDALCRGDIDISSEVSKRLTCRYLTENHPFLKIAPIKMEMLYLEPDVILFYDVISEDEIQHIKEISMPKLKRADVIDSKTGKLIPAQYRISKSAWLQDRDSTVVARISRRISHMTGLNIDTAEMLQVGNYGVGGHYDAHLDFGKKSEASFSKIGSRVATVMFYLSDVAQGGATVFTELGLSVFPVKHAAAFWLNLQPSGEGDLATCHAACPVLRGSKWVSNKWLRLEGQEWVRPCNLEYQKEGFIRKIPKPVPKISRPPCKPGLILPK